MRSLEITFGVAFLLVGSTVSLLGFFRDSGPMLESPAHPKSARPDRLPRTDDRRAPCDAVPIRGVPSSTVLHRVEADGWPARKAPSLVDQITLVEAGKLRGRVTLDNDPVSGATVIVSATAVGADTEVRSDSDGRFEFPRVPPGVRFLDVQPPMGGSLLSEEDVLVLIESGEVCEVEIHLLAGPLASLRGTASVHGVPLVEGTIQALRQKDQGGVYRAQDSRPLAADGTFAFPSLPPGGYELRIKGWDSQGGLCCATTQHELRPGEIGYLSMDAQLGQVRGTLIDARTGAPIDHAPLTLERWSEAAWIPSLRACDEYLTTAVDGSYRTPWIPTGRYRLCWYSEPDGTPLAIGKPLRVSAAGDFLAPLLLAQLGEAPR